MGSRRETVLVTGGAGFVGAHACKALARAGFLPVAYDNLSNGHSRAVKWGPLERGSILDAARLSQVLDDHRPVAVMHFAALAYVGVSVVDPAPYYETNVTGSLRLLEAMRGQGVNTLVFSSSCAVYGNPSCVPITEETPKNPVNPYGRSKLMFEHILGDMAAAYGLKWTALRYFNAAGADPDGELEEDHDPETHLIPLMLDAALGKRDRLTIHGDDYDTPDGTCVRDFVHVADLADAHISALARLRSGDACTAFNLGTGTGHSVREVMAAITKGTGLPVPYQLGPRRPGDPPTLVADAARAKALLDWRPTRSDLAQIVRTAWEARGRVHAR